MISDILLKIAAGELITQEEATELRTWGDQLQNAPELFGQLFKGISSIPTLSSLATNLGTVNRGVFISGNGDFQDASGNDPFTGVVMMYPGLLVDSGADEASIFGMNAGTLTFWISNLTGKIYAGAGAVILDDSGVSIVTPTTENVDTNWLKFVTGSVVNAYITGVNDGSTVKLISRANADTDYDSYVLYEAKAKSTDNAQTDIVATNISKSAYLRAETTTPSLFLIVSDIGASTSVAKLTLSNGLIDINSASMNVDTVIQGDTDASLIYVDASTDRVGIGDSTPSYKLDVNGDVNVASGSNFLMNGTAIGTLTPSTNTNNLFRCDSPGGTSAWAGTIATLPGGSALTYSTTTGTAASMVPASTSQLAKMRLYNTTRSTSALISNCVTGTTTITLTAAVPGDWQVGDVITIASQTVTGAPISYVDLEITSGYTSVSSLLISMICISATPGDNMRLHPFETYGVAKQQTAQAQVAGLNGSNIAFLGISSNVFSFGWTGTPTNVILAVIGQSQ